MDYQMYLGDDFMDKIEEWRVNEKGAINSKN
jgi:hypothetical protein